MQLSETINVFPVDISVRQGVAGPELDLRAKSDGDRGRPVEIALDQQTAAEFLPVLLHFIETGEMPK